jgi:C-terminal processing protease CtpA/Prc
MNKEIAYINNGSLKKEYLPKIWKEMQNTKGLIIDMRNYPFNKAKYDFSSYLMPKTTPFVKSSKGSIKTPGLFIYTKSLTVGKKNKNPYRGKIVLLVNEISQFASEFQAMVYKAYPNTITIGSTTAGADGAVSHFSLPGGISTAISGMGIYYPDGRETQRIGIVPDIEVKPTIKGITDGRDELIEKAIELINKQ